MSACCCFVETGADLVIPATLTSFEQHGEHQYLTHMEQAVTDPASRAHASLYEFLLAIFTKLSGMLARRFEQLDDKEVGRR